jgi:hypothetical protein
VVEDLVSDDACHLEALLAGDRVDDHVTVNANEMLRVEDTVLILANGRLLAGLWDTASGKMIRIATHASASDLR